MRLLLSGYYGFGNTGDELLLQGMVTALQSVDDVHVTVLSQDPDATQDEHGVKAVSRNRPNQVWQALRGTDLLISGGGSLLQDRTSRRSPFYYLGVMEMARRARRPVMMVAQGIGPIAQTSVKWAIGQLLPKIQGVSVRDPHSKQQLLEMGLGEDHIRVTADPAFILSAPDEPVDLPPQKPLIGVVWRSCEPAIPPDAQRLLTVYAAQALTQVARQLGAGIVIFPFHPSMDMGSCRELVQALRRQAEDVPVHMLKDTGFRRQFALLSNMDLLLAVRYHGLVLGCVSNIPTVSIAYDPKVEHLSDQLGIRAFMPYEVQPDSLSQALLESWERRKDIRWEMNLFAQQSRRLVLEEAEQVVRVAKKYLGGLA